MDVVQYKIPAQEINYSRYREVYNAWARLYFLVHTANDKERDDRTKYEAILKGLEEHFQFEEEQLQVIMKVENAKFNTAGILPKLQWRQ